MAPRLLSPVTQSRDLRAPPSVSPREAPLSARGARDRTREESQQRAENLARYIRTLLGEENVHPSALEAIAQGQVEWAEVKRAGEHWRKCSAIVTAREGEEGASPRVPGSETATATQAAARAALRQTGVVLQQSRVRLEQLTQALTRVRAQDAQGPSPAWSPQAKCSARSASPSPLLPVPEEGSSPGPRMRRLTFSPSETPSPESAHPGGHECDLSPDAPTPPAVARGWRMPGSAKIAGASAPSASTLRWGGVREVKI